MSDQDKIENADSSEDVPERDFIGPAAFILTSVAVLVFFWWLLIFDHGVQSVH